MRLSDNAFIPNDPSNTDYQIYLLWVAEGNTALLPYQPTQADIEAHYITVLENYFDSKAKERKYDNRYTCSLRAGYAGPFQAEGIAFATWMDNCNAFGYQLMETVKNGIRMLPTEEELISLLPELVWPQTVVE